MNIKAIANTHGAKIAAIIELAMAANNSRLNGLAMTESQKFAAERAVKLGLMTRHFARFPGFQEVPMFEVKAA